MNSFIFTISRLWNYLNIYFLKPFDAVNDTLTATLIKKYNWEKPYLEIGSGDGMFSYIMHGGSFPLWFDRYLDVDLKKSDIFDTHSKEKKIALRRLEKIKILNSVDAKDNHIKKIKHIGFSKSATKSEYEKLPFKDALFDSIFLYIPHGLKDYELCLKECFRILKSDGRLIVLNYNNNVKNYFLSYNLSKKFNNKISDYFKSLDNGRFAEITKLSKTLDNWKMFFEKIGFKVISFKQGLNSTAWKFYDIQTRPILNQLITFFNFFPSVLRTFLKLIWMIAWYPILIIFYYIFSNTILNLKNNCYNCFCLKK